MRTLLAVLPMLIIATSVQAVPKYTSTRMTCDRVQATVRQHGIVVLAYPSKPKGGRMISDTYVASRRFCRPGEITDRVNVPSANRPYCPVLKCKPEEPRDGGDGGSQERGPNDPTHG